jgi:hypothetical protein
MLKAEELAAIETQMAEQHRKDREAMEWLKHRFLQNGHTSVSSAAPLAVHDDNQDDDDSNGTIRSKVAEVFQSFPDKKWTVVSLAEHLKSVGVRIEAKRPQSTLGPILNRLQHGNVIRIVRRGRGRTPSTYRLAAKHNDVNGASGNANPAIAPSVQRVVDFLQSNGPSTRREIVEKSAIPEGTIANVLTNRKDIFRKREGKWEVKSN